MFGKRVSVCLAEMVLGVEGIGWLHSAANPGRPGSSWVGWCNWWKLHPLRALETGPGG